MSVLLNIGRGVLALLQPITGERASGTVRIKATGSDVTLCKNTYMTAVIGGQLRPELQFKTSANAGSEDGSWTITSAGVDVDVVSNIGGVRHNLPAGTRFLLDPDAGALEGFARSTADFTGGTDPSGDLTIFNGVMFDTFGTTPTLEMFRSAIGGRFPAVILTWMDSEPADGLATSGVRRGTHQGRGQYSMTELFDLSLIVSRADNEMLRRGQALRLLDEMTALVIDRNAVDGFPISNPGGVQVRRRIRSTAQGSEFYQEFRAYTLNLALTVTHSQRDSRVYSNWISTDLSILKDDDPDIELVNNNRILMQE